MAELPFPWDLYEEKQKQLMRSGRISSHTWGLETGLQKLLAGIEAGTVQPDTSRAQRDLETDISSASWSERNRTRLLRMYLLPLPELDPDPQRHPAVFFPVEVERRLSDRIRLMEFRNRMTAAEWVLVVRVAAGFSCRELAQRTGTPAGGVRTKLSRLRARLKREV